MAKVRIRLRATCLPLVIGLLLLPASGLAAGARNVILMIGDGVGPDGKTPCKTVLEVAKDKRMATGLVTSSGIMDATPAAFAAHVAHRSEEMAVAVQELQAEMTAKTLEVLGKNPKGFFAMIEGGRIDHAAHRNDAATTIREVMAFDDAVGVALDFQR